MMVEEDLEEGENSNLEALTQCNKELEDILESLGDQNSESFLLEYTFQKNLKDPLREAIIVVCPWTLRKCFINLRNKMENSPPAVQLTNTTPNSGKGKSLSFPT